MCQKNHYSRRIITVLLAVITALFVFGAMLTGAHDGFRVSNNMTNIELSRHSSIINR